MGSAVMPKHKKHHNSSSDESTKTVCYILHFIFLSIIFNGASSNFFHESEISTQQ